MSVPTLSKVRDENLCPGHLTLPGENGGQVQPIPNLQLCLLKTQIAQCPGALWKCFCLPANRPRQVGTRQTGLRRWVGISS